MLKKCTIRIVVENYARETLFRHEIKRLIGNTPTKTPIDPAMVFFI